MADIPALIAEVDQLPDEKRSLLTHNERVLIDFCRRLAEPLRTFDSAVHARVVAARVAMREHAAEVCINRARYFDAAKSHREWTDAARSYRATAEEIRALPLKEQADASA